MKKTIVLTIAGTDYSFNMTAQDHNDFIDGTARQQSITALSYNLLTRTVEAKQKDDLKKLLEESPGAGVHIASTLGSEFSPVLAVTIKK